MNKNKETGERRRETGGGKSRLLPIFFGITGCLGWGGNMVIGYQVIGDRFENKVNGERWTVKKKVIGIQ